MPFRPRTSPYTADAYDTKLPLTSYRHSVRQVAAQLVDVGFKTYATVLRAPELDGETTFQGFVIASSSCLNSFNRGSTNRRSGAGAPHEVTAKRRGNQHNQL